MRFQALGIKQAALQKLSRSLNHWDSFVSFVSSSFINMPSRPIQRLKKLSWRSSKSSLRMLHKHSSSESLSPQDLEMPCLTLPQGESLLVCSACSWFFPYLPTPKMTTLLSMAFNSSFGSADQTAVRQMVHSSVIVETGSHRKGGRKKFANS